MKKSIKLFVNSIILYLSLHSSIMTNLNKKKQMKTFIETITVREYELFRRRVMAELNVTRTAFANWKAGQMPAKRFRAPLNAIAQEITGKTIFPE